MRIKIDIKNKNKILIKGWNSKKKNFNKKNRKNEDQIGKNNIP
jgi:hypothetical protein